MNNKIDFPFDKEGALKINEFRINVLDNILENLKLQDTAIRSCLDAGCGVGYFAKFLKEKGFDVKAFDIREENIVEAKTRVKDVEFFVDDIEELKNIKEDFDLVLCFGLLYHLENPLKALRNLAKLTKKYLIIESMIIPDNKPTALLVKERQELDQSKNYVALIPSEELINMFLKLLDFKVYKIDLKYHKVNIHNDFKRSLFKNKSRTIILASRKPLYINGIKEIEENLSPDYLLHYRKLIRWLFKLLIKIKQYYIKKIF
jgi:2-polyprenyl-3-methyl-5-hydroxy-6-metoxy-1,4-benzoquinol methylase